MKLAGATLPPGSDGQIVGESVAEAWCAEKARTQEGYYRTKPDVGACIQRGLAYAPHCDLIWMETGDPNLDDARAFAEAIHAVYPDKMLSYNLSPSFNWDAAGLSDGNSSIKLIQMLRL